MKSEDEQLKHWQKYVDQNMQIQTDLTKKKEQKLEALWDRTYELQQEQERVIGSFDHKKVAQMKAEHLTASKIIEKKLYDQQIIN